MEDEDDEVHYVPEITATSWPHRRGIGTRLNYGVDGEVLLSVPGRGADVTGDATIPRVRDGPRFLPDPKVGVIREPSYRVDVGEERDIPRLALGLGLILRGLLAGVLDDGTLTAKPVEEAGAIFLKRYTTFDPSDRAKIVCYSFNGSDHYLAFTDDTKLIITKAICEATEIDGREIRVPQEHRQVQVVEFGDWIQEVKHEFGGNRHITLLVRCRNAGYLVDITAKGVDNLTYETKFSSGALMAAIETGDIGVVEANGSATVYNDMEKVVAQGKLDTDEVSGWRQVLYHDNTFYFALRQTLSIVVDRQVKTVAMLPQDDHFVNLQTAPNNSLIILTTGELIWYRGRERVLSWEVYYEVASNPQVMVVPEVDDPQEFTVWVLLEWTVLVYTFGYDEHQRPISKRDPYMIEHLPLPKCLLMAYFQIHPEVGIVYGYANGGSVTLTLVSRTVKFPDPGPPPTPLPPPDAPMLSKYFDKIMKYVDQQLPPPRPATLEEYAQRLTSYADKPRLEPTVILEEIVPISETTDFDELQDMFTEMKQYFASKRLQVTTSPKDADDAPFAYYCKKYPDIPRERIAKMVSCLTQVINLDHVATMDKEDEQLVESNPIVSDLISRWGDEALQPTTVATRASTVPETTIMPSIKLTQTQPSATQADDTQGLALATQTSTAKRSMPSQKSRKKKKKKKGGFA